MIYKTEEELTRLAKEAVTALGEGKHLLITGEKSSGKSYFLGKLLVQLEQGSYGGICTKAVRDGQFFPAEIRLYRLGGEESSVQIAKRNQNADGLILTIAGFENTGKEILQGYRQSKCTYIVIDELGILESHASAFQEEVFCCLEEKQGIFVLRKANSEFLNKLRRTENTMLVDMDW